MHRGNQEKSYLGHHNEGTVLRRLYMTFKMSQLFSEHDGDMLVRVLNKQYVQTNVRSAF